MHPERHKLTRDQALARVPRTALVTMAQLMHAAALTSPLPIRKWIHQGRLTPVPPHADRFARQDVIRFLRNRFSPYSLLEARLYRTGVTLMAAAGSTGELAIDQPRLHAALDRLFAGLGSDAYARAVDRDAQRIVLPRSMKITKAERAFQLAALKLLVAIGAAGRQQADLRRLHAALDEYITGFGGAPAYGWAVRHRARQLGIQTGPGTWTATAARRG